MTERIWSDYTGISNATLRRQRASGTGAPFLHIGRLVRYRREPALAWLDSLADAA